MSKCKAHDLFKVGDVALWDSFTFEKKPCWKLVKVVRILRPGEDPKKVYNEEFKDTHYLKPKLNKPKDVVTYFVEKKMPSSDKPYIYWPIGGSLTRLSS